MNKIIYNFLLTGDKFMPELHLKQPGFTYGVCGLFAKHFERIQRKYRYELDKACFAHDAAYFDDKHLGKRTISDTLLKDGSYEIARNLEYDGYQRALASMVYKFDKKTGLGIYVNEQIAEELHKLIVKKFKRRDFVRFKDNIWAADLAEMWSLSSKNKDFKNLCFINVFTKYASVKPLKDKDVKTVLNNFTKIVNKSNQKPNKLIKEKNFIMNLCKNS